MLYVLRDKDGNISGITTSATGEKVEEASLSNPEVMEFLADSDFGLIRVIEDLVDVLVQKNVITITDLPEQAQLKLLYRKNTRTILNEAGFVMTDDEDKLF